MRINGVLESTSVLQYANDTIMFLGHSENMGLQMCFLIFHLMSGLRANMSKSCLVGIEVDFAIINSVASVLGCQVRSLLMKCLGLHLGSRWKDIQS